MVLSRVQRESRSPKNGETKTPGQRSHPSQTKSGQRANRKAKILRRAGGESRTHQPVIHAPPVHSMRPTEDEFATMAFINHILDSKNMGRMVGPGAKIEAYLGPIPASVIHPSMNPMMSSIVMALGLVSAPLIRKDAVVQQAAWDKYSKCLALTTEALKTQSTAVADETLMTVILLQLYEALTWGDSDSLRSWTAHVDGAARLLELRGEAQFKTKTGLAMFTYVRQRVISGSIRRYKVPSPALERLSRLSRKYQSQDELFATDLADAVSRFCEMRSLIRQKKLVEPDEIVERMSMIDAEITAWEENLPKSYAPTRFTVPDTKHFYEGCFDLYSRRWIAAVWNKARIIRTVVNQALRSMLPRTSTAGTKSTNKRLLTLRETIVTLSKDICASVPFIMAGPTHDAGALANISAIFPDLPGGRQMNVTEDISPVELIDVNAIAWVLFPIAEDRTNPPPLREWVLSTLQALLVDGGKERGEQWASAMEAHLVEMSKCTERSSTSSAETPPAPGLATVALLHMQGGTYVYSQEQDFEVHSAWGNPLPKRHHEPMCSPREIVLERPNVSPSQDRRQLGDLASELGGTNPSSGDDDDFNLVDELNFTSNGEMHTHNYRPGFDMDEVLMCPSSHLLQPRGSPTPRPPSANQTVSSSGGPIIRQSRNNNPGLVHVQRLHDMHKSLDGSVVEAVIRMLGQRDERLADFILCMQSKKRD